MATRIFLRFDEKDADAGAADSMGALADLVEVAPALRPDVVQAFTGFGRVFEGEQGLRANDLIPGRSLLTRDVTIQTILRWDYAAQWTEGDPGVIIARGIGGSASQYVCYGLELRVVDVAARLGEVSWWWQDLGGARVNALGGYFTVPEGGYFLLTATRRWVTSEHVEVRYFVGAALVGDGLVTAGNIGGGVSGSTTVGYRIEGGVAGNYLCGVIDELLVRDDEVCLEETEATWSRIADIQPSSHRAFLGLLPPGAPISEEPGSNIQRLLRIFGQLLGYVGGQIENQRRNQTPNRSYGSVLEEWEQATGSAPRATASIKQRRKSVCATMQRDGGVRVQALAGVIAPLLDVAPEQLQAISYTSVMRDGFGGAELDDLRWMATPASAWSVSGGQLHVAGSFGDFQYTGAIQRWRTCLQSVAANGRAVHLIMKCVPTSLSGAEMGLVFLDMVSNTAFLLGVRRDGGGVTTVVLERFVDRVSQGLETLHSYGGSTPAAVWLWLGQLDPGNGLPDFKSTSSSADYQVAWSTVSAISGYSIDTGITHKSRFQWAGAYARSTSSEGTITSSFDEDMLFMPFSERPSLFYFLRDPAIPGTPDFLSAHQEIQRRKHAHTDGTVIVEDALRCDTEEHLCDRGPLGGG